MGVFLVLVVAFIAVVGVVFVRQRRGFQAGSSRFVVFPTENFGEDLPEKDLDFIRGLALPTQAMDSPPPARPLSEGPVAPTHQMPGAPPMTSPVAPSRFGPRSPVRVSPVALDPLDVASPTENGYSDPTLQLLPGRLEIIAGMEGAAIRFVKQPGTDQELTLGRNRAEGTFHVQIPSPTVSRLHCRLKYESGTWTIRNLSETNPVAVNGRAATGEGAECILSDGDRIEMGEVALLFRKR